MFVFFPQVSTGFEPNDVLEPGEAIEFEVGYHGESAGTTDITAHLHASFSVTDLFPRTNGTTVEKSVTIRSGLIAPVADRRIGCSVHADRGTCRTGCGSFGTDLSGYDATYVALAESLDVDLLTTRSATGHGHPACGARSRLV